MKKIKNLLFILVIALIGFVGMNNVKADSTVLYNDGTLIINEKDTDRESNIDKHGTVLNTYAAFNGSNYDFCWGKSCSKPVLWANELETITRVEIGQEIQPTSTAYWFQEMPNLESVDLSKLDTSNVTNMKAMFAQSFENTSKLNLDLSNFDVSNVTNMNQMFISVGDNATEWSIGDLSDWDTSKVTDMFGMFKAIGGSSTTDIDLSFLSNWNVSSVRDISDMFRSIESEDLDLEIDLSNWSFNHDFGVNATNMFSNIEAKTININLSDWSKEGLNGINIYEMFSGTRASSINIDVRNWNVPNMTNVHGMFMDVANTNKVDEVAINLSNWDVSNITNMNNMFAGISAKKAIIDISNWGESSATNMTNMFGTSNKAVVIGDLVIPNDCDITDMFPRYQENEVIATLLIKGTVEYTQYPLGLHNSITLMYENETASNTIDNIVSQFGGTKKAYTPLHNINANYLNQVEVNNNYVGKPVARPGDMIEVNCEDGYMIKSISVKKHISNESIEFDYDNNTFEMPNSDIDINVTYVQIPQPAQVPVQSISYKLIDYTNIEITWGELDDITMYELNLYKDNELQKRVHLYSNAISETKYLFDNLEENTYYQIGIKTYVDVDVDGHIKTIESQEKKYPVLRTSKELMAPTVTAKNTNFGKVLLSWNAVDGADGYHIYYKKTSDNSYSFYHETQNLSYEINQLVSNDNYEFKVVAVAHFIHAPWSFPIVSGYDSNFVFESKLFGTAAIKTMIKPTAGAATLYGSSSFEWTGSEIAEGYKIYYKEKTAEEYTLLATTSEKSYDIKENLSAGIVYNYKIVPYITLDEETLFGQETVIDVIKDLNPPTKFTLKLTSYNSVKASWDAVPGADGYYVYYKATGYNYALLGTTTKLTVTKTKMLEGKEYYFKIVPYVVLNGEKVKSNLYTSKNIYTLKKMAAPTVVKYNNSQVRVKWSKVNGASGYQIARSLYKTKNFTILKTVNNGYSSYRFKATKNKIYYYKVRTYRWVDGKKVFGPWSNVKAFKLK